MLREDYLPDRNSITDVNIALTRHDDARVTLRLTWTQHGVRNVAEVQSGYDVPLARCLTYARDAVMQIEFWHTTLADVYGTLAGEDRGLSVER